MAGVNLNVRERRPDIPQGPEQAPGVEHGREIPIRVETPQTETAHDGVTPAGTPKTSPIVRDEPVGRQLAQDVEAVLEDGLGDLYQSLDEATKREFKSNGEKTASKIAMMLRRTHVQVRKVLALIASWLRILPGISTLFIEQEAKIKTDQVLALRRGREEQTDD